MSAPTKGPWEVGDHRRGDNPSMVYADDALGSRVADCSTHGHGISGAQAVANARLISLAPEMAEMLRSMEWVTFYDDENGGVTARCVECASSSTEGHTPACRLGNLLGRLP